MKTIAHEAEPSPWLAFAAEAAASGTHHRLAPWALPGWAAQAAPPPLQRFAKLRQAENVRRAPGFVALELAGRLYSRGRRDRMFRSQFALRQASSIWASATREAAGAEHIIAPSLAARRLFAKTQSAKKTLLLDLPLFRTMHEDLDRASRKHPSCAFLQRYRAPEWAIVQQEAEIAMADCIIVRGRFARAQLVRMGVPATTIRLVELPCTPIRPRRVRTPGELHVLLPGLAAARHGTSELLSVLAGRPWLRVHLRRGEGSEPEALLRHPQCIAVAQGTLEAVDAVIAPSLCEAYFSEVSIAARSGIPTIATERGAGATPHDDLTIELPNDVERGLACALDALFGAEARDEQLPSQQTPH